MAKKSAAVSNVVEVNKDRRVAGVLISKVNRPYLAFALAASAVEHDREAATEVLVEVGAAAWAKLPEAEIASCSHCGGVSPSGHPALDACGFCAIDDEGKVIEVPQSEKILEEAAASAVKPEKGKKKDKAESKAIVPKPKDDLLPASSIATERELDEAVAEVSRLKGEAAASQWDLGAKIGDIYKRGLWQLRKDDHGKPRYASWEAFVLVELKMSHTNARTLMDVSDKFSREQIFALGTHKLGLALQLPPEQQPRLLEKIEAGATKREVEEEVRRQKKETGFRRPNRESPLEGGKKGGGGKQLSGKVEKGGGGRKPREEKITVASVLGTTMLKAYKRPPTLRNLDVEQLARAKRFADLPFAIEKLANGVHQIITLSEDASGFWQFKIERKRVTE